MTALVFENATYRWDIERYAMEFVAYDGDRRVPCLISGEALHGYFGAPFDGGREGMVAAFLAHREHIEAKAREMYRAAQVDAQGRVLLRSIDFRNSST